MPKKEVVTKDEIIFQVELKYGPLTQASLEKLTLYVLRTSYRAASA